MPQALCIISKPSVNSIRFSPETPNLGRNRQFLEPCDPEIWQMTLKTIGDLCYATSSFVHHVVAIGEFKLKLQSANFQLVSKSIFFSRVTLKFDRWPWKTTVHLCYATPSCVHHFVANGEFKLDIQSGNAQLGSNSFFGRCDLEIWQVTLKNNKAPLLSNIKLCASFHHHILIQTGVTVRKRLTWVLTSVTLTFNL